MELPQPQAMNFSVLISEIEKGQIKIPQFQRNFVWIIEKSANLIDSIIKGYPIGTFIFWRTTERLRSVRNIGNQELPEPKAGESVDYVLDGQQRLTSIYACLKGLAIKREGNKKSDDFSKIYINLESKEDEKIVITEIDEENKENYISILVLLTGDFTVLGNYDLNYHEKIKLYKKRIESYQYSVIQVNGAPIDIATEIFTRINVGGKHLSLFEIMVAKTFDQEKNFDLSEKFEQLINKLAPISYETISDATVLQVVSMIISKECNRKILLGLDKGKV